MYDPDVRFRTPVFRQPKKDKPVLRILPAIPTCPPAIIIIPETCRPIVLSSLPTVPSNNLVGGESFIIDRSTWLSVSSAYGMPLGAKALWPKVGTYSHVSI